MLRLAPLIAIAVLILPISSGVLATLLPAFGWFPALGGTTVSAEPFRELFRESGIWQSVWLSLKTGLLTTMISLGLVVAFFAAWSGTRLFERMRHLVSPLLAIPHAAGAFGLAFMIAPSGFLMRLVSPELTGFVTPPDWQILMDPGGLSMSAGLIVKEVPFLFLVTLAAMPQARAGDFHRVASGLGYGRMAGFVFTVWPQLYPQIRLAVFAVIAYATSVVDVALILGPTSPAPLAVRLVGWMGDPDLAMRFKASAGAILQLGLTVSALLIWIVLEKAGSALLQVCSLSGIRYLRDGALRWFSGGAMALAAVLVLAGLAVLAIWSFAGYWAWPDAVPRSFTLKTWMRSLDAVSGPLWITLLLGLAAMVIAIVIVIASLENEARTGRTGGSRSLWLLYLPLIMPQPAFLFGLKMFFLAFGVGTGFAALVSVHLVFVLPYVFLSLADPWRAWDSRYAQVSDTLGGTRNDTFWKIRLPMLAGPVLVAAAIGFAVSVGQYLPTVLIGAGRWPTLTTEAVALASGGDRRVIGVYAFLQMFLPFAGFAIAALVPAAMFANRRAMRA